MAKNIAIIGPGNVGTGLAQSLSSAGHRVWFGVRGTAEQVKGFPARPLSGVAEGADVVFLTVPYKAAADAVRSAGGLAGKIVVDCTNPVGWSDGPVVAPTEAGSGAESLAAGCQATIVKGFNTFGAEFHANPRIDGARVDTWLAGDDPTAKALVKEIAESAGFRALDAGPLRNARLLEHLAVLWIHLATVGGRGRNFTFQLCERA